MITRQVKLIEKKEFITAILDLKYKSFLVFIFVLSIDLGNKLHSSKKTPIAHLKVDKAPTNIPSKYTNFAIIFSLKFAIELPKYTEINDHAIKFIND